MRITYILASIALCSSLLMAQGANKQDDESRSLIKSGQEASKLLLQTLQKNLKMHMKHGGATEALTFCSNEAQKLTEKINKELPTGVSVKRISLKYRNGVDAPLADEQKVLESLEKLQNSKVVLPKHMIEKVDDHTYKFYKPLVINNPACLMCHGDISKNPALQKMIADKYPGDKATGYKMGDLRGAVVVTIKK